MLLLRIFEIFFKKFGNFEGSFLVTSLRSLVFFSKNQMHWKRANSGKYEESEIGEHAYCYELDINTTYQ